MKRFSFSKERILKRDVQFKHVLSNGTRFFNNTLTIYIAKNDCDFSRLGVSVGKSFGNAVKRNRIKRLVREAFRLNQNNIPCGYDYFVLIKKKISNPDFELIENSFMDTIKSFLEKGKIN